MPHKGLTSKNLKGGETMSTTCPNCGADLTAMFKDLASKGGKGGTGEAKRRSKEHYARIAKLSVEARKARKLEESDNAQS